MSARHVRRCSSVPLLSQRPCQRVHSTHGLFRSSCSFKSLYQRPVRRLTAVLSQSRAESSVTATPAQDSAHAEAELQRRATAADILKAMSAAQGQQFRGNGLDAQLLEALHLLPLRVEAPKAWRTLERAVAQSGQRAFVNALEPRWHTIPPLHATAGCGCCLTSSHRGRRFKARELNLFSALLFQYLPAAVQAAGLPEVHLNAFDLHHGHIFISHTEQRLGVLFHSKEYPAEHPEEFPINLGNCQTSSSLQFDQRAMDLRNILWYEGAVCVLDVGERSVLHGLLLMEGLEPVRTVLESDFGVPLADLNYFHDLRGRRPPHRVFICVPGQ